jgi:hypothetical protein
MVRILTLVVFLGSGAAASQPAGPNPEEAAILAVVDRFMVAVSTNDSALLSELRLEGGFTVVERPGEGGKTLVTRRVFKPGSARAGDYRERYWDPVVHVRGSIAVVWTPYEFWTDGKTTHCGIDVFDMVKEQGAWKIANMMWTVEPDACPALRPKDPARVRPAR